MHQWYLSYDGKQIGPLDTESARVQCAQNRNGLCWRQGYAEWLPISQSSELLDVATTPLTPPAPRSRNADEIDYKIFGEDMQYVEIELDPGESAVAEAGAMMFKESVIRMDTIFGDGSKQQTGGFFDKLVGAGKRLLTGESLFITVFTHGGPVGKAKVGFAAPYPGTIIPLHLSNFGGRIICQKDSFLCAAKGCKLESSSRRKSSRACSVAKASSCRSSMAMD
jgi:Mitochondrial biogenesis AIM24/GYF domain 2